MSEYISWNYLRAQLILCTLEAMKENVELRAPQGDATPRDWLVWHDYLYTSARIFAAVEAKLRSTGGVSLSEYDVLLTLRKQPNREMTMNELRAGVLVSLSGLSRCISRLEKVGYVAKSADENDRRSVRVKLTKAGEELIARIGPQHESDVYTIFFDYLSQADRKALAAPLRHLAEGIEANL